MDITNFYENNNVEPDFDENFYAQMYPETIGFYQPYCSDAGIDERKRLYFHYFTHGKEVMCSKNASEHYYSFRIPPPTHADVSVVLGCMNREKMLNISIRSWLYHPEIKEIIITDWSSKNDISYFAQTDPRVKIIRVEDKQYYNASTPVNMAIKQASCNTILKLDVDYIINPYARFGDLIDIEDNEFITGDWSDKDIDNNLGFVKGANGFLCVRKKHLEAVGYYNEDIENYGREDCEMFEKLINYGLQRKTLKFDPENLPLYHNPHSDFFRSENFEEKDIRKSASYLSVKYGTGTFDLIINLYKDENIERREEILSCLKENLQNKHIAQIHVFLECDEDFPEYGEICKDNYTKIITHKQEGRPSFKQLFDYAQNRVRKKCIIANNDVVFSDDLEKIKGIRPFHVIALTRYEQDGKIKMLTKQDKTFVNIFSHDAWVINPPMYNYDKINLPEGMKIGTMFSDPGLTYFLKDTGLLLYNLADHVKIHHKHITTVPLSDYIADESDEQRAIDSYNEFWKRNIKEPQDGRKCFVFGIKMSTLDDFYTKQKGNNLLNWHSIFPPNSLEQDNA